MICEKKKLSHCVFSSFHHGVNEIFTLLGCYISLIVSLLLIGCPESSITNYRSKLRNIPKERRSHPYTDRLFIISSIEKLIKKYMNSEVVSAMKVGITSLMLLWHAYKTLHLGKTKQAPLLVSGKTYHLEKPKLMTLLQNGETPTFEYSTIVMIQQKTQIIAVLISVNIFYIGIVVIT